MRLNRIVTLDKKDPAELIPVTLDFKNLVSAIDSVVMTVSVKHGTDANPAAIVYSSAQISGTQVRQLITGGLDGVIYQVRADIASGDQRYAGAVYLPVEVLA